MSAQASDICADFLVEAGEILDQLGEQMVALESAPGDRECLNAVFRGFHTIKGGAGFLDFPTMVAVCHAVEDRLNAARSGELSRGRIQASLRRIAAFKATTKPPLNFDAKRFQELSMEVAELNRKLNYTYGTGSRMSLDDSPS